MPNVFTFGSAIDGNVNVTSLAATGLGGSFDVSAITSNGRNTLNFPTISPQAKLNLNATTSSGAISVVLDEAYEGEFKVRTSEWAKIAVVVREDGVSDPEGMGRKRNTILNNSKGGAKGRVWWGEKGEDNGKGLVVVKTSLGKATLVL